MGKDQICSLSIQGYKLLYVYFFVSGHLYRENANRKIFEYGCVMKKQLAREISDHTQVVQCGN